jgi:hypothetical protein
MDQLAPDPRGTAAARFTKFHLPAQRPPRRHREPVVGGWPRVPFGGRLLLLGSGSVSRCLQPLLLRHLEMDLTRLTVLDFDERAVPDPHLLAAGASHVRRRITPDNLHAILGAHLGPGDLLVNLTWDIGTGDLIDWCQDHGVLYVDTSVELWGSTFADCTCGTWSCAAGRSAGAATGRRPWSSTAPTRGWSATGPRSP